MREQWARRIAILTGILVFLLALTFAYIQNPLETSGTTTNTEKSLPSEQLASVVLNPQDIEAGRLIYRQQACALCHSIAGQGNARYPLDSVGEKHDALALRHWITADQTLKTQLSERVFRRKQAFQQLPDKSLDALVVYLQSLRSVAPGK